jgi:hypothetical protein
LAEVHRADLVEVGVEGLPLRAVRESHDHYLALLSYVEGGRRIATMHVAMTPA